MIYLHFDMHCRFHFFCIYMIGVAHRRQHTLAPWSMLSRRCADCCGRCRLIGVAHRRQHTLAPWSTLLRRRAGCVGRCRRIGVAHRRQHMLAPWSVLPRRCASCASGAVFSESLTGGNTCSCCGACCRAGALVGAV